MIVHIFEIYIYMYTYLQCVKLYVHINTVNIYLILRKPAVKLGLSCSLRTK